MFLDKYLADDKDLMKCVEHMFEGQIFKRNKAYIRRKLISLLLKNDDLDIPRRILVGAFLLIDGRMNQPTLEMMQEESAILCIVSTIWRRQSESIRLRRIFLELMYEMLRIQKLSITELREISYSFIECLFKAIEDKDDYDHDPYGFAVLKVLVALNEQYMIASYDMSIKNASTVDHLEPIRRAASFPLSSDSPHESHLRNKVFETLIQKRDQYRSFGESIVFILNRRPDNCLQLMVLKFFYLIFTTPDTYNYLYLNDLKVIVDVFIRELYDLETEEERLRHTYLRVMHPLLSNTELKDEGYKRGEIIAVLEDLIRSSVIDVSMTTQILTNFILELDFMDYDQALLVYPQSTEPLEPESLSHNSSSASSIHSEFSTNSQSSLPDSLTSIDNSGLLPPPPPPPSRTPRRVASDLQQRPPPPPPTAATSTVSTPPRLPLPRKKSYTLLNTMSKNSSTVELPTQTTVDSEVPPVPPVPPKYRALKQGYFEKALPAPPPPPSRPRLSSSHSSYK